MVDSTAATGGEAVIKDPSENVRALMLAAIERLDALRDSENRRIGELADSETRRVDDLRDALLRAVERSQSVEAQHGLEMRQVMQASLDANMSHTRITEELRADYQEKLAIAEAKRIDAIRSVDVAAVAVASERATAQASVLANQVAASADALRALVATTATTFAQQQTSLQTQVTERLSLLERSQYENKGKAGVEDPRMIELVSEMKALANAQSNVGGQKQGADRSWQILLGAIALVAFAMPYLNKKDNGPTSGQPPIIYVQPAPTAPSPVVIQPNK